MKWLISSFIIVFFICSISMQVSAQQSTTISVSPAILDLAVRSGEKLQAELIIRNGGEFALPISTDIKSLIVEDEIVQSDSRKLSDASTWIIISDKEFILDESESKTVPILIDIPTNATPGGHYAQIAVRGLSLEKDSGDSSNIVIPEVSVTVLISVAGDVKTSMLVDKNAKLPLFVTPNTKYQSSFAITNNGNIHDLVTPVFVVEKNGIEQYRQTLTSVLVLPNTKKLIQELFQLPNDYASYDTRVELNYANNQKVVKTELERIVVAPPIPLLVFVAIFTVVCAYIFEHRKNIKPAWQALFSRNL